VGNHLLISNHARDEILHSIGPKQVGQSTVKRRIILLNSFYSLSLLYFMKY